MDQVKSPWMREPAEVTIRRQEKLINKLQTDLMTATQQLVGMAEQFRSLNLSYRRLLKAYNDIASRAVNPVHVEDKSNG